jgi:hypothetical protein
MRQPGSLTGCDGRSTASDCPIAERRTTRSAHLNWRSPKSRECSRTAAVCAFSVTSRAAQRDGVAGADMLESRTLLRPGDRERTGGLRRDVPGG